jgi:hypothetical protein
MSSKAYSGWNPFKPFGRERADVARILAAVLDKSIDCREWDDFLTIPMKGTPELEAVRLACEALESEESMDENGFIIYTQKGQDELRRLLRSLEE